MCQKIKHRLSKIHSPYEKSMELFDKKKTSPNSIIFAISETTVALWQFHFRSIHYLAKLICPFRLHIQYLVCLWLIALHTGELMDDLSTTPN